MNTAQIEKFKRQLQVLLQDLQDLESISKSLTATVVLDQNSVGRLSRMDAMQGQQMALETERRRKLQIVQIKAALKRIDEDDFGYCLSCGEEIVLGRLQINPAVTQCVACAE